MPQPFNVKDAMDIITLKIWVALEAYHKATQKKSFSKTPALKAMAAEMRSNNVFGLCDETRDAISYRTSSFYSRNHIDKMSKGYLEHRIKIKAAKSTEDIPERFTMKVPTSKNYLKDLKSLFGFDEDETLAEIHMENVKEHAKYVFKRVYHTCSYLDVSFFSVYGRYDRIKPNHTLDDKQAVKAFKYFYKEILKIEFFQGVNSINSMMVNTMREINATIPGFIDFLNNHGIALNQQDNMLDRKKLRIKYFGWILWYLGVIDKLVSPQNLREPIWQPDSAFNSCQAKDCRTKFTFTTRRHHCRQCGRIICSKCSRYQRVADPVARPGKSWSISCCSKGDDEVRVCKDCYNS
ncbi:MAG: hypothetical protein GY710_26975 [Desulfobacteraceae bacterium]|nr:hypothetical protein [Desulfobacteraceae bacterium]